jgi:hypothetical protein
MADIELNAEQEQRLRDLRSAISNDQGLRARLESNPRAVFEEYGLGMVLPAEGNLQVSLEEAEVEGFAKHSDSPFRDSPHKNQPHADHSHADSMNVAGLNIEVLPGMPGIGGVSSAAP